MQQLKWALIFGIGTMASAQAIANSCKPIKNPDKPFRSRYVRQLYPVFPIGGATRDKVMRSRSFGIAYHSNGLEYRNPCIAQARLSALESYLQTKIQNEAASEASIAEFRTHAQTLITTPRAVSDIIDRCFSRIRSEWQSCGGKYAKTAREMTRIRKELTVQIMPSPFFATRSVAGATWVAGLAVVDRRSIFVSTSFMSRASNGLHYTRSLESLVCWELGNTFAMNHGKRTHTLNQEVGFQNPCKFFRN